MTEYCVPWDLLQVSKEMVEQINSAKPGSFEAMGKRIHVTHLARVLYGDVDPQADVIICCCPTLAKQARPDLPVWGDWDNITRAGFVDSGFVVYPGALLSPQEIKQRLLEGTV